MTRWQWLAAAVLVVVFAVALAPARILTQLVNEQTPQGVEVRLLNPTGTLWRGTADMIVNQYPAMRVAWRLQPASLLRLMVDVELDIVGSGFSMRGQLQKPFGAGLQFVDGSARANATALQVWLAPYDIRPSGELTLANLAISELELTQTGALAGLASSGNLTWSGGDISYRLAGRSTQTTLPPLTGILRTQDQLPHLEVTEKDKNLPLIVGHLTARSSIRIGITQGFTRLAGRPWPGSEPDHKVVLEVEEPLI